MARILVSFWQPLIGDSSDNIICYYESFAEELKKFGNEVLILNRILFTDAYFRSYAKEHEDFLVEEVRKFNPDLIIAFNNQIFECILENTNCPVGLFDADSSYLFSSKDCISKYIERYFMVTHYENWENVYSEMGFSLEKICTIKIATSCRREEKEKNKNISFIGTKFLQTVSENIRNYLTENKPNIYKMLKKHWSSGSYDYEELLKEFCPDLTCTKHDIAQIFDWRNYVLSSLLDLGLNLYGVGWRDGEDNNIALMSAYDSTPKFSLKHNQDVYNESKICLSISHPQTRGYAFPWRVYDIMATSGMLISSYSSLLKEQTKDFVDIPMYNSPYDARDLCKKYLKEANMREDIVCACNDFIEKHGRWESNFRELETFFRVKLINTKAGSIKFLKPPLQ